MTSYVENLVLKDMATRLIDDPVKVDGATESVIDLAFEISSDKQNEIVSITPHCTVEKAEIWIRYCNKWNIEFEAGTRKWYTTVDKWAKLADSFEGETGIAPAYRPDVLIAVREAQGD